MSDAGRRPSPTKSGNMIYIVAGVIALAWLSWGSSLINAAAGRTRKEANAKADQSLALEAAGRCPDAPAR